MPIEIWLMSKKNFYCLPIYLLCIFLLQSNLYPQNPSSTPEPIASPSIEIPKVSQPPPKPEDLIHFGDVIDVDIVGSTEYDWRGRITPEGFLDGIDFVEEPINALCRSEEAVAADVAKGYAKLLRNPQVVVRVIDRTGRPNSFLYGAVKTPHRFLLQRQVYLNELIVLAGGITDKASGEIQILRPSKLSCDSTKNIEDTSLTQEAQSQKISTTTSSNSDTNTYNIRIADLLKGEKDSNPQIVNGDIVTVLEAAPIYIIGGVLNPKQINVSTKMTVSRAIASAGGLAKNADPKNVFIFRRALDGTKVIQLNLDDIKTEKAEDLVLQKFDIIDVGQAGTEKRKFPPVIKLSENLEKKSSEMPLRIIR